MSILVTRPSPAGEELVSRLRTLGQVAWHFPLIEFSPGQQLPQLADQLAALGESDLLFALSQHAVAFAQSQLHQQDRKWPRLLIILLPRQPVRLVQVMRVLFIQLVAPLIILPAPRNVSIRIHQRQHYLLCRKFKTHPFFLLISIINTPPATS